MSQHPFRLVRWVVLLACICVVQMPHHAEAFSGTGDGLSAETAFIITTCDQLQEMNNELELYYKLGNDINCSATASWNPNASEWVDGVVGGTRIADPYTGVVNNGYYGFDPIGQESAHNAGVGFTGTLDGQGYSISNLWIFRKEDDFNGLIGYASGATIKNLTLVAPRIVGSSSTGGIVGYGTGVTLENLTNQNGMVRAYLAYNGGGIAGQISDSMELDRLTVSGGTVHGSGNIIGGLVGWIYDSAVSSSTSSANIDGGEYIGGAFGSVYNVQAQDIVVTGSVESNTSEDAYISGFSKNSRYAGGFAGRIAASTIQHVTTTGDVVAGGVYAGGFAGVIEESSVITYATTSGDVLGYGLGGGFAGLISSSTVYDAIARGNVELTDANAGGFAGQTNCSSVFLRVGAYGNVAATGSYVGGFVGSDGCEGPGSTFTQAAAHGDVTSSGEYVGGFIGFSGQSTVTDAYAGGNVTGSEYIGGFAGYAGSSDFNNTYARGVVVSGDGATRVGGYGGEVIDTEITWSFTNSTVSGQSSVCGVGGCAGAEPLTTGEAKTTQTYVNANWNVGEVWEIDADLAGYPHFIWERFGMTFVGSGTSQDPYQVTQCFTAQSAGYYQLQQNIEDVTSTCIDIQADGVNIDGNGHSIMGNDETSSTAIYTEGYDSVRISNMTIGLFSDGIRLYDMQGESSITSVTIATSRDNGIELRGVHDVTISDVTIINSADDGITVRMFDGNLSDEVQNYNIQIQENSA
jgi:hypothetical protein